MKDKVWQGYEMKHLAPPGQPWATLAFSFITCKQVKLAPERYDLGYC